MQMQENVLTYVIEDVAGGEFYIDLAESMSILNRKLHRQQGLWKVDAVCAWVNVHGQAPLGMPYSIAIGGAPRNWVTRNALVKAFEFWKEQQATAYDALGSDAVKPRWQDFKVYLNENHRTEGSITPTSGHMFGGDQPYDPGEWVYSRIVYEDVVQGPPTTITQHEPLLHILGNNNGTTNVGLIQQYSDSRVQVHSPDPDVPTNLFNNIYVKAHGDIDAQTEEIVENLMVSNDEPPYDVDNYPGDAANGEEPLLYAFAANTTTLGRKLVLNGFTAPNGLLEVQVDSSDERNMDIWLQFFVSGREAY